MNDHEGSKGIESTLLAIRVIGIALIAIVALFWFLNYTGIFVFPGYSPMTGPLGLQLLSIALGLPGILLVFVLADYVKNRDKFQKLWASTSGKLSGRAVAVNIRESRPGKVNGAITLLMQDGTDLFIFFDKKSTGYVPKLHDHVNITIDRKKRAIKTELVEKAS
jgi:uncharacterized membrane protein